MNKKVLAVVAAAVMSFAGTAMAIGQEAKAPEMDPGGFFVAEVRPWADALGTWGDAWINLGIGYQSTSWFADAGFGYPSALSLMGDWFVQGGVIVDVTDRTTVSVGATVTAWVESFQTWDLYIAPFLGFDWAFRPSLIVFARANLPLYVYEELPLLGTYLSFGVKVTPW